METKNYSHATKEESEDVRMQDIRKSKDIIKTERNELDVSPKEVLKEKNEKKKKHNS